MSTESLYADVSKYAHLPTQHSFVAFEYGNYGNSSNCAKTIDDTGGRFNRTGLFHSNRMTKRPP
jgi:hypothetical protein